MYARQTVTYTQNYMWRHSAFLAATFAVIVVALGVTGERPAYAGGVYLVDNSADDAIFSGCLDQTIDVPGDCTLRGAIILANFDPTIKVIVFGLGAGVPTILPQSQLPAITAPVIIEGASGGATRVNISGANGPIASHGLYLKDHQGSTIRNMVINDWEFGAGIRVTGGGTHTIQGNFLGTNTAGTAAAPNDYGIEVENATNVAIGGVGEDFNVISGNVVSGVLLGDGATLSPVAGNLIGLSVNQTAAVPNGSGIGITGDSNQIGTASLPNVIAGNTGRGIRISGSDNTVQGNLIGLNEQDQARPNGANGIYLDGSPGPTLIGGSLEEGNVISGNGGDGITIESATNIEISGNIIGLEPDGEFALPNSDSGIEIFPPDQLTAAGVTGIQIGKPGAPNTISGNGGDGIVIGVGNVVVQSNTIGASSDQTTGFANGLYGINVTGSDAIIDGNFITSHQGAGIFIDGRDGGGDGADIQNNFIGGVPDVAGNGIGIQVIDGRTDIVDNTIVSNTFDGVDIQGDGNRLSGNFIGTNSDGDEAGNGGNGVTINGNVNIISQDAIASALPAGGPLFPLGANIIWNNSGAGVFVAGGTSNSIQGNWMRGNGGGAIDLAPEGRNPNDSDDPDQGANDRQNHPVLTLAASSQAFGEGIQPSGGGGFIQGSLNSTPNSDFIIDVYIQPLCNASGVQPAEEWVGSFEVTTNAAGDVAFSRAAFTDMQPGSFVNATATNDLGSTSELSDCIQVGGSVPTPTPSPSPGPTATPSPTPSPTDVFGDADCDGDVDMDDFVAVMTEVAGVAPGAPCADQVGCEDPVDARDALDIVKYVASPADYPLPDC